MLEYIIGISLIVGSIVLAAVFSGAEMGFISLNRIRLKHLYMSGSCKAIVISHLIEDMPHLLATLLIGINLAIVTASCITTYLFIDVLFWAEVSLTLILLIFGEIIPKTIFRHYANKIIIKIAYPLKTIHSILLPLVRLITKITNPLVRWDKGQISKSPFLTKEEILLLMEEKGDLNIEEEEMLDGVFSISKTLVREVMTPRMKMISLKGEATFKEICACFSQEQYSRVPVYDETIDDIVGIIYVKDILSVLGTKGVEEMSAIEFIRFPYFVPMAKRIDRLLDEFQTKKTQIAIVVDEYGGTAGLVTLEDLLEEIVGEIHDEYEKEEPQIKPLSKGVYLIDAKVAITQLNEELGWRLPTLGFETISGLILEVLGRIPLCGEVVEYEHLKITIIQGDERSIEKVKVEEM